MAYIPSTQLVPPAKAGDIRAIARLLTRAEAASAESRDALDAMYAAAGRAHVVGITGVPGSGKSTLVALLTTEIRRSGRKVGIIAIDPSSPFSGGAILGDRIRMGELAGDPGVYVRSMATRGALGGLASGTHEAVDVLDAAGYDMVLIETVGVGQDEVDVARAAHTTVVVSAPGLGDDIQAIKAGILEIADVHVVSKCDRSDANRTIVDLKAMLGMGLAIAGRRDWNVPVVATSSAKGEGIVDLLDAMDGHWKHLNDSGRIDERRQQINERRLLKAGEQILRDRFARHRDGKVTQLLERLQARAMSPHAAAAELLESIRIGDEA